MLTATALVAAVGDGAQFRNGREMAAWLGLVPRQHSTGGRPTLLGVSKRGDRYLRTLSVHGARAALTAAGRRTDRRSRWALDVRERRGWNVAVVALANKNARTAWTVLARGAQFDAALAAAGDFAYVNPDGRRERPERLARGEPRRPDTEATRANEAMLRAVAVFVGRAIRGARCATPRHYRTAAGSGRRRLPRHVAGWSNPVVTGR